MSESPSCYICGHATFPDSENQYHRCRYCGCVRTAYSYNEAIYNSAYASNYLKYAATDVNVPLNLFRVGLVSRWLKIGQKILDIGCCNGEFVSFAERWYPGCVGFEPNESAARNAKKHCNSKILTSLNGNNIGKFHYITFFDVLEHIEDPREFLKFVIQERLAEKGIVAITTPNVEAIDAWNEEAVKKWKHYKPKEHLFLFTEAALMELCSQVELEPIHWGREESDIRPGNPNGDIMTLVARRLP